MPPIIEVKESFKVAVDNGNQVIEIEPGEHDVDDRIADVAVNQLGVAELVQTDTLPEPEPDPAALALMESLTDKNSIFPQSFLKSVHSLGISELCSSYCGSVGLL